MSGYVLSPGRRGAPRGLAAIETRVRELEAQREAAREGDDTTARASVERELRYWSARRASARPQSLLGREAGESVSVQGVEAEIVSIEP